jgi:polysaccharide biosynthesis/export protein
MHFRPALALFIALAVSACASGPRLAVDPAFEAPYTLDGGDKIRVVVFGQEGVSNSYAVNGAGKISMPLIGLVDARGLTTAQVAASITTYAYVNNLTVETAVAIAGGFSARANRSSFTITRTINGGLAQATVPLSYAVRPGDTITIHERWF